MAVCGRCLLCGYKFNGRLDDDTEPDVAIRWPCESAECKEHIDRAFKLWGEVYDHAICTQCHDHLVNGTIEGAVGDLVALVARRSSD